MPARRSPAVRRHKHTDQVIVYLDGAYRYFGPWSSAESHAKAHAAIAEYLALGRRVVPVGQTITVAELVDHYLRSGEARDGRDRRAVPHILELYSSIVATEFGPIKLRAVRDRMVRADLCRGEVNKLVGRLVRMFRWGVSEELVPPDVAQSLAALRGLRAGQAREAPKVGPVSEEDFRATLPFLSVPLRAVAELQWWTGMRSGEVLAMTPAAVDRSRDVWVYKPVEHKTAHLGYSRLVLIGPQGQAVLAPWLDRPAERHCFRPAESRRFGGERYTVGIYAHAIYDACRRAGVPAWHAHQLRHSAACRVRDAAGLDGAQAILGHRHAQTTEIYAELNTAKAAEIMRRVG